MRMISLEGHMLGKYRVLEPLGRGGMAQVYRAYHPQLDRYVAIKVLRSDLVDEEGFLVRFRREAQAVASLRHANVVQVFDFDIEEDVTYMVMELLEGDTLKSRLNDYRVRGERMPWGEIVRIMLDVLDGLAYAHSEGMIHRDVKPANILLTQRGQAIIADFGIAQIIGSTRHTTSGALMGTLNYMAPEQGLEGESDARSDLYSLGIVLYEMLTQRTPFDADTPLAILMKHLNDPLPLPQQFDPHIPSAFERVVLKALAKRPQDRYQNAEEMACALRAAAEEVGVALPARISLPFSFTTTGSSSESVAVLSGTAREHIPNVERTEEETDHSLKERLATAKVEDVVVAAAPAADRTFEPGAADEPREETAPFETVRIPGVEAFISRWKRPGGLGLVLGSAAGLVILVNLWAVIVAGVTGRWTIYDNGWVAELFLVTMGLSMILGYTNAPWLVGPTGFILGNGMILTYCTFTGNWEHWVFLWIPELALIGGLVGLTILLYWNRERAEPVTRALALGMGLMAAVWGFVSAALSFVM